MLTAVAICVFIISGSILKWGRQDTTQQQVPAVGIGASETPSTTPSPNATLSASDNSAGTAAATAARDGATATADATPDAAATSAATLNEGPLVWDTSNGQSFHFDQNCSSMKGATQETMLAAFNRGLKPCPICVTSAKAVAARPDMTVKAVTTLPSSLGNVVIQDPQVFDIIDIVPKLGKLGGKPALMISGTTTGSISILYTNQPDTYDIRIKALLTDSDGKLIWSVDGEPASYTQSGLDMPREISLVSNISTESITGMKLTVLVYAPDGFKNIDADLAVLGMYETTVTSA